MVERAKLKTDDDVRRPSRNRERLYSEEPNQGRPVDQSDRYPAQLEAVMESVEEGVVICDAAGRVVRMNRRALEIHEYTSIEGAWRSPSEFADTFELQTVEGHSIPQADWPLSRAVRGETFRDCEVRLYNKRTGREWIGRCGGTPVRDEQGKVVLTTLTLRELRESEDGVAEELVRQTEQKFRTIFDHTSDGIFLLDLEAKKFTMCNKSCQQMLGYTLEEFMNLGIPDLHLEEDLPFIYAQIEKFLKGDRPIRRDIRFKRKDGGIVLADLSPNLIWLDGKRYAVLALKDVTERKRAEEVLQKERDQAREYLRVAGVMMATLDAEGRITLINEKGCEILGYRPEEILGRDWFDVCLPREVREEVTGVFRKLMAGDVASVEYHENPVLRKDGQQRVIAFHNTVLRDLSSQITGILFSGEDITEYLRLEEELRRHSEHLEELVEARTNELQKSETRYRSLYHTIADGVFVMGADGRINDVNDSACAQLGYTREELIGMPVSAISGRPDFDLAELFDKLRTTGSLSYETSHRRKDGTPVLVELSVALIEYGGQPAILGLARDITERKQVEEALHFTQFAIDHTADAAFWMTEDARFFYVNEAACRALGYPRDELLKMTVYDIDPAFTESKWLDSWRRLKANKSIVFETVHRARDGRIYPVEIRANYVEFGGRAYDCAFARDITKRKRAEEALRESEERHRFLVESLNDWIWEVDRNGVYTYASPQCREMLGYEPEEIIGKAPFDLMPPDEAGRVREIFAAIAGQAKPFRRLENVNRHKDGRLVVLETNGVPVLDAEGKLAGYRGIDRDITERKRADQALRESERLLRRSQEVAHVGHWSWDIRANRVTWSDEMHRVFGIDKSGFDGDLDRVIDSAIHPEDRAFVLSRMAATVQEGTAQPLEYRIVRPDGSIRHVWTEFSDREFDATGRIIGLSGIVQDITDRKRAEEALRESEERYRLLLDRGFDGIFVHENFRIVQLNDRFAEMTGYTRAELLGLTSIDLFTADSQERIRQYIRSGAGGYFDLELRHRDGRILQLESFGAPCQFQGRDARIVGLRDVTERKLAAEALQEKEYLLSESQRIGHIGTWSVDLATNYATWTSETYRLFGVSPETFVPSAETLLSLLHPDDRGAMREWIRAALAGEHPDVLEFRVVFPDGSIHVLSGRGELIFTGANEPVRLVGTAQDVTEQKQAEVFLRHLNEQLELQVAQRTEDLTHTIARLQQLTLELSQAEDRERKRIADLLHDDVQQTLAAARFHLDLLGMENRGAEESREIVRQVRQMLRDAIEKARNLSHELSPALYQIDLTETLNWLAHHMQQRHGLTVHVDARGQIDSSSEPLKAFLYKVAQELLFNVVKHAATSEATLGLRRVGRCICLSVLDRGRGFNPQELEGMTGVGLPGIRERVQLLGGRMKIKSMQGKGSRFVIIVPDEGSPQAAAQGEHTDG